VKFQRFSFSLLLQLKSGAKRDSGSSDQTCPVHALEQWLHFAKIGFGPVFVRTSAHLSTTCKWFNAAPDKNATSSRVSTRAEVTQAGIRGRVSVSMECSGRANVMTEA